MSAGKFYLFLGLRVLSLALGAVACTSATEPASTSNDDVIGGVDALSPKLDAVGLVLNWDASKVTSNLCTGTLIAPDLVLTAKHCVYELPDVTKRIRVIDNGGAVTFRVGADGLHPSREVRAKELFTCEVDTGGSSGLGCDVAVYRLAEAITSVTPLRVATTTVPASQLGKNATAFGYGTQSLTDPNALGTRKMATMKVRAIEGQEKTTLFPTFDDWNQAVAAQEGEAWASANRDSLKRRYDRVLLDGYEVAVGGAPDNGQTCPGDSGGPLVINDDGVLTVYGVDSTGNHGKKFSCQNFGAIYAMFGPSAQDLFAKVGVK